MKDRKLNKLTSEKYNWQVLVHSEAHLDNWIMDYFGGLTVHHNDDGTSLLEGELPDMSAVYGLILQLRDAGILLISLQVKRKYMD